MRPLDFPSWGTAFVFIHSYCKHNGISYSLNWSEVTDSFEMRAWEEGVEGEFYQKHAGTLESLFEYLKENYEPRRSSP